MTILTQDEINLDARKVLKDYRSRIYTAPFKNTRILGVVVQGAWQIEQQFVASMKRVNALATIAPGLHPPFDPNMVTHHEEAGTEPGLLDEG